MWWFFAVLSSVFAALTSVLAKVGVENVNSNLATAIRTVVVLVMLWLMVFVTEAQSGITEISKKKLAVSDSFRPCNGRVMAVLLQGAANWRRFKGCSH